MRGAEQGWLLKAEPDGYSDRLCRACTPHAPAHRPISGPPPSASSPFPYPYRVIGMVMIAFVGVATFDKSGTGATSILQAVIWVSAKRQLRNATLAPSCSYYASCAAARGAAVGALGSQPVGMTHRISRHTAFSPHRSKYLGEQPFYMRLS